MLIFKTVLFTGSEVAKYCELHFPEFVKMLIESQKDPGDTEKIIKSAFLAFDATLTQDEVVKELKVLCGKDDEEDEIDEGNFVVLLSSVEGVINHAKLFYH